MLSLTSRKRSPNLVRHLSGTLVLLVLAAALFYAYPAWAAQDGLQAGHVLVRVSPLTLLLENAVTIKVGDHTCDLVTDVDPASQCSNLPPGEYDVVASAAGYFTVPASYPLTIPGAPAAGSEHDRDTEELPATTSVDNEFFFRFYPIHNQLYLPTVQAEQVSAQVR